MIKKLMMGLGCIGWASFAWAQCNCGSSQMLSIVENGSPALTLPRQQWTAEVLGEYRHFKPPVEAHAHDHGSHSHGGVEEATLNDAFISTASLRYGLTDRITLSLQQPLVGLFADPEGDFGLGDLLLTGTLEVLRKGNFGAALQLGGELPTGKRVLGMPDRGLMIGSGSWDAVVGAAVAQAFGRNFIRGNALYKRGNEGFEGIDFGSFSSGSLVYSRTLWGNTLQCAIDSTLPMKGLNAYAGFLYERSSAQRQADELIPNTGSQVLFAQAGLLLSVERWAFPIAAVLPLWQDAYGVQGKNTLRLRLGVIANF